MIPTCQLLSDGSLSDTAVDQLHGLEVPQTAGGGRRESQRDRDRQNQFGGLSKKSNSTSQISVTGEQYLIAILLTLKYSKDTWKLYFHFVYDVVYMCTSKYS